MTAEGKDSKNRSGPNRYPGPKPNSTTEASQNPANQAIAKKMLVTANIILARYLNTCPVALILLMYEEADFHWLVGTSTKILPTDEFMMAKCGIRLLEIWDEGFRAVLDVEAASTKNFNNYRRNHFGY